MKQTFKLLLLFIMMTLTAGAQGGKSFTLEDLMPGGNNFYNLLPENNYGLKWWQNTVIEGGLEDIKTINPRNGKKQTTATLEEINNILKKADIKPMRHLYNVQFPYAEKLMTAMSETTRFILDLDKKEIVWKETNAKNSANHDWNKLSRNTAYTVDNNLYVVNSEGKVMQVTDEPEGVECGKSVHQNEFGISKGTFWSPDGSLLAFYKMDERMVKAYPQVNTTTRIATPAPQKYPMAGTTMHKVYVGIFNPATNKTVYMDAGDPTDRFFTNISWSPDQKHLYIIELNRDQNHSKLTRYNAETGKLEAVLFEETDEKYVEPLHPIIFLPWDENKFIYQSERDGFNHLYLYDIDGKLIKQITKGEWLVQDVLGFNSRTKELAIMSTEISPLQTNPFMVKISNGKTRLVGEATGCHRVQLSEDGKYIIDNYQSHEIARKIDIIGTKKNAKAVNLLTASNPMDDYNMPEIELGTIKAADGVTDLYYRLVKPVNFDSKKKYPAVIYVYGGPHAQLIHDVRNYDARGWDIYMAQLGYVMLTVDSRGSDNRGLKFENCTHRKLGTEEMKDQMEGVKLLKSLTYVDQDRLGVHGWSFGGFMTINLMLTYPEVFKVGVAGGPVIDWKYYEIMYGERYMDTPQSNPEGYKNNNLKLRAGNLKGRLEIIIGANDPVVVPQHAITFLRACIDAGADIQPDFFIYPGDGHNMYGRDRVHLYTRITRYFEDFLK